jgi:RIO kinase 1
MDFYDLSAVLDGSNCIAEVLHRVKSGKEADVYCCAAQRHLGVELLAAKVYRPLESRGFRNDSQYQQGRYIADARLRRAYHNKSRAGRSVQFLSWIENEYETLKLLHEAGARVPRPYETAGRAVVMQYIGTQEEPAIPLYRLRVSPVDARQIAQELFLQIGLWFANGRIHGDLSPYNVLCSQGLITVIDFPQAVDPSQNSDGFGLLLRDVDHIVQHFLRYEIQFDAYEIARSIWNTWSPWKI